MRSAGSRYSARVNRASPSGWANRSANSRGVADYGGITYDRIEDEQGVFWPCTDATDPGTPRLFADRFAHPDGLARFTRAEYREPAERTLSLIHI